MQPAYLCAILVLTAGCVKGSTPCQVPHGAPGVCVPLERCANLYALTVLSRTLSANLEQHLRQAECTMPDSTNGVCCQPERAFEFPRQCGVQSSERISRGNSTLVFEYPWVALLMYQHLNSAGAVAAVTGDCAGSLINDRYVLTAAHCVRLSLPTSKLIHVRLGEHTISTPIDCNMVINTSGEEERQCADPTVDINIETAIVHPKFNDTPFSNDVALIRLAEKVQFKDHIQPICLPLDVDLRPMYFQNYTIAGWGYTRPMVRADALLMAVVPRVENAECQRRIDQVTRRGPKITISDQQLCAGSVDGIETCKGDSGGPLMKKASYRGFSRIVLFGVISFGTRGCGMINFPGVYVHVGSYIDWIIANMFA